MPNLETQLLELYIRLGCGVLLGWVLGRQLPKIIPVYVGKFLFWVGVPISIFAFLRQADLSGQIWIAPAAAWVAILLGAGLAWIWIKRQASWIKPTQGSFLLAAMVGNTGYLGYPVTLSLVQPQYFGWALFYDLIGTTLAAYGLGVILAARFGLGAQSRWQLIQTVLINPALWSFGLGLVLRHLPLPTLAEQSLHWSAWAVVALSLVLIGMRLSQLSSWGSLQQASISLGIKMLLVPLFLGICLSLLGVTGPPQLVIVLQMAMPPAFATLVLAEAYNLDRELAVTALAVGSIGLLVTIPVWLLLFGA
ncbi:MAG: AEC family transporter [Aphanothece sp. CMT-3BRIN-NPC111]|jgi:hypothetical protein|nr:AEC family transporter [Aphanothece sp. CMT-3BRIN-NPC111]